MSAGNVEGTPVPGSDPALWNHDLAPVPQQRRTWTKWHFAALWVGMVVCVPSYNIAAGMITQGLSWWQAVGIVLFGNLVVLVPILMNAHAGTKYGVPFPVFARASFGVWGANVPALLRAVVACGWFGIQTWIGGASLFTLYLAMTGGTAPEGLTAGHFIGFGLFWAINVFFIWKGTESIKFLETWAAPFLLLMGVALLAWGIAKTDGLGAMLAATTPKEPVPFWQLFWPNLTAMVGFWATLSINIPDFTRYAKSQKDQIVGQAIGLPGTMAFFAFIGVAVTGATMLVFGEAIWDPTLLVAKFDSPVVIALSTFALAVATLSTNIAANVVGPANDIANVAPRILSFRMGGVITACIGILMMPWKLLSSAAAYTFTWLVGYSALLGPIGGILIADYFIVRGRHIEVEELYRKDGLYRYSNGFNWRALVALFVGIAPSVPGFLRKLESVSGVVLERNVFDTIYDSAWFVGFGVAAVVHVVLMKAFQPAPTPVPSTQPTV